MTAVCFWIAGTADHRRLGCMMKSYLSQAVNYFDAVIHSAVNRADGRSQESGASQTVYVVLCLYDKIGTNRKVLALQLVGGLSLFFFH